MMKNSFYSLIFLIFLSSFSQVFGQSTCSKLISRVQKDSEWNLPNYFKQIDHALSNDCGSLEKIELYLLKAKYFGSVEQYDKALTTIKQAEVLLNKISYADSLQALIHMRKSGYYANLNDYSNAYQEWVQCNNYYTVNKNYNGMSYTQQVLAVFLIQLKQFKQAKKTLDRAKRYAFVHKSKEVLQDLYGSYSGYWGNKGQFDSSLYYLRLSEQYEPVESVNFRRDYNKAVIYLNKGDVSNARLYFQECVNKAEKVHCEGYVGVGTYGLAVTYMEEDHDKSFQLMKKALDLIQTNNPDLGIMICECILSSFTGEQYADLLPFFEKRNQQLKREREKIDEVQVGKLLLMTSSSNESLLRAQNELEQRKEEQHQQRLILFIGTILGFSLCVILGVIIFYYRKGVKSRKKLNDEYENQKRILTHSLLTITSHNATTENLSKKLKGMALQQTSKKLSDELYALSKTVSENALGAKSKELKDLDYMIRSINDGFVKRLCSAFENLSSGEITLAIYLRMNFTTKQIAELKGTSENSIDVARSRLRSKLGIKGESTDLSTFLNKI